MMYSSEDKYLPWVVTPYHDLDLEIDLKENDEISHEHPQTAQIGKESVPEWLWMLPYRA